MNEKLYQDWITNLESGNYKPTGDILRNNNNEFCCLGVLCDIYNPINWDLNSDTLRYNYLSFTSSLPPTLVDELNFGSDVGYFCSKELSEELQDTIKSFILPNLVITRDYPYDYDCTLTEINDRSSNPFPIIAKILRERPPSLFKHE